jgi:hypothetical protein
MKGYAPGWQVRCTRCGRTRDAGEVGITRVGAWSRKKYTIGKCSRCNRWAFVAIERKRDDTQKPAGVISDEL